MTVTVTMNMIKIICISLCQRQSSRKQLKERGRDDGEFVLWKNVEDMFEVMYVV